MGYIFSIEILSHSIIEIPSNAILYTEMDNSSIADLVLKEEGSGKASTRGKLFLYICFNNIFDFSDCV